MAARPTNKQLVDYLRSTGTGEDKLLKLQALLGQGNKKVPEDACQLATNAELPSLTVKKMAQFLNPDEPAEENPQEDSEGYTIPGTPPVAASDIFKTEPVATE